MTTLHVPSPETEQVLREVALERKRQDERWGEQNHRDGTGPDWSIFGERGPVWLEAVRAAVDAATKPSFRTVVVDGAVELQESPPTGRSWFLIAFEEVLEALNEADPAKLRAELVQVAAVAVAWVEAIDRRPTTEDVAAALEADGDPQGAEIVRAEAAE